jgi:hypothetical protein
MCRILSGGAPLRPVGAGPRVLARGEAWCDTDCWLVSVHCQLATGGRIASAIETCEAGECIVRTPRALFALCGVSIW